MFFQQPDRLIPVSVFVFYSQTYATLPEAFTMFADSIVGLGDLALYILNM